MQVKITQTFKVIRTVTVEAKSLDDFENPAFDDPKWLDEWYLKDETTEEGK